MTEREWWMFAVMIFVVVAHFALRRVTYKNGVWDGAYCQFLPDVQRILGEYHNPGSVKACQRECATRADDEDPPGSRF